MQSIIKSESELVKEFTEGSTGNECPKHPHLMDKNTVIFLIRMVMSELNELANTVSNNEAESMQLMKDALNTIDVCHKFSSDPVEQLAEQADSLVDANYYMLNIAAKHGMNLSELFKVVHAANMAKRDPQTGQFIRRKEDGKVIKPANWKEPDVVGEIKRQLNNGSWN